MLSFPSDIDQYLLEFYTFLTETRIPWLASEQQKQFHTLLDKHFFDLFFEYITKDSLRKRVLAAGLEYLNKIIEIKTTAPGLPIFLFYCNDTTKRARGA